MTDLLSRPLLRVTPPKTPPSRPLALVAALGALAVAVGGLVLFTAAGVVGWFAADTGSFNQAIGAGALSWLVGNGSGLVGPALRVSAVPLGFPLLSSYGLYRAGRWAASTSAPAALPERAVAAAVMGLGYGAVAGLVSAVVRLDGASAPLPRTAAVFVTTGVVSGGIGLWCGDRASSALLTRLPEEARAALRGGLAGVLAMLGMAGLVVAGSLVAHVSTVLRLADGLHGGVVGGLLLALVSGAMVPNALLCAGAFAAGPGFSVGAGTHVSPTGVHVGLLPDLPVLAALPTSADARWLPALVLLPVVAGGFAALVAVRRYPVFGLDHAALRGGLAGLVGGGCFGALTVLATGGVGPGRLQAVGPDVPATTVVCAVAFALGGVVTGLGVRWLGGFLTDRPRGTGMFHRRLVRTVLFWRRPEIPADETADWEVTQPVPRPPASVPPADSITAPGSPAPTAPAAAPGEAPLP